MSQPASTPIPPYYAVIFTALRSDQDQGYADTAERMFELAERQTGFLGVETAHDPLNVTVSYWTDLQSISNWKRNSEHLAAQRAGRRRWYRNYTVRIAKVEQEYSFEADD